MSRSTNNVLVGVTGGIACYKTIHLCRLLIKSGYDVKVIMTQAACAFIQPLTFQAITRNRVYTDEFEAGQEPEIIEHIALAEWADEFIIAPATADVIAKIACGIADTLLTSAVLAYTRPIHIAPAMNVNMFANPATQKNVRTLASLGHDILEPAVGEMACRADGKGRMPEPEEIFDHVFRCEEPLKGLKVLVSAGATSEPIDPVRFITNRSSGKMGTAIAEQAEKFGAEVTLVAGNISVVSSVSKVVKVVTALDMLNTMKGLAADADILIMTAAVADYRSAEYSEHKIKKSDDGLTIKLVKNPDILKELSKIKKNRQVFVGFAAESDNLREYALKKLREKNLDIIAANDISRKDIGFEADDNEIIMFFADGTELDSGKKSKSEIASDLLMKTLEIYRKKNGSV